MATVVVIVATELRPFSGQSKVTCPKCASEIVPVTDWLETLPSVTAGDCLCRICTVCGFNWFEQCADGEANADG